MAAFPQRSFIDKYYDNKQKKVQCIYSYRSLLLLFVLWWEYRFFHVCCELLLHYSGVIIMHGKCSSCVSSFFPLRRGDKRDKVENWMDGWSECHWRHLLQGSMIHAVMMITLRTIRNNDTVVTFFIFLVWCIEGKDILWKWMVIRRKGRKKCWYCQKRSHQKRSHPIEKYIISLFSPSTPYFHLWTQR